MLRNTQCMISIFIVASMFLFVQILNIYIAIRVCKERIFSRGRFSGRDTQLCILCQQNCRELAYKQQ